MARFEEWQSIETAPHGRQICVGTQYGESRWAFNHAWFNPETEKWTDEFGDQELEPHVWCDLPPKQPNPKSY